MTQGPVSLAVTPPPTATPTIQPQTVSLSQRRVPQTTQSNGYGMSDLNVRDRRATQRTITEAACLQPDEVLDHLSLSIQRAGDAR